MSADFWNTPSHKDLAGYDEVRKLLERWTANGAMQFRWPSDDNSQYYAAVEGWLGPHGALGSSLVSVDRDRDSRDQKHIDAMDKLNDGVAFEAFRKYWESIIVPNAQDVYDSTWTLSRIADVMEEHLNTYKKHALVALLSLKEDLDEIEPSWWPWRRGDAEKQAKVLIAIFDENMKPMRETFDTSKQAALRIVRKKRAILEQISLLSTDNLKLGS
ncbi:hypothetical protein [Nonomuraea cavernae]|uniref:Uncharacterized protein n=1 Tax=Nonomuraea cavernae TaxID=2045107 RepID=A0A917ZCC2_9ACTN|nr:hypothetical protein [Nonomuraea cavernae]MCA2187125.1 hypothetical protein [Nonomuraea cavernae]GGO79200.1 hypothetical protein GCM10012289_62960 [Nonomuraea cavernae]